MSVPNRLRERWNPLHAAGCRFSAICARPRGAGNSHPGGALGLWRFAVSQGGAVVTDQPNTAIRLDHVEKRFPGAPAPAVTDLSLDIPEGELVALVGPSGCGKTTTLRMINRLEEPTGGRIEIDGVDVRSVPVHELRRGIGYVIQQTGLFPHRTIADNIATVPAAPRLGQGRASGPGSPSSSTSSGSIPSCSSRYPAALSGGQQQRVGVARALAADPPVLLMDEPYSAVDPIVRARLQDELLDLQRRLRKTVVLVTHDIDEAIKLADRVAILDVGGVLAAVRARRPSCCARRPTTFVELVPRPRTSAAAHGAADRRRRRAAATGRSCRRRRRAEEARRGHGRAPRRLGRRARRSIACSGGWTMRRARRASPRSARRTRGRSRRGSRRRRRCARRSTPSCRAATRVAVVRRRRRHLRRHGHHRRHRRGDGAVSAWSRSRRAASSTGSGSSTTSTRSARRRSSTCASRVIAVVVGFVLAGVLSLIALRWRWTFAPDHVGDRRALHDPEPGPVRAARADHRARHDLHGGDRPRRLHAAHPRAEHRRRRRRRARSAAATPPTAWGSRDRWRRLARSSCPLATPVDHRRRPHRHGDDGRARHRHGPHRPRRLRRPHQRRPRPTVLDRRSSSAAALVGAHGADPRRRARRCSSGCSRRGGARRRRSRQPGMPIEPRAARRPSRERVAASSSTTSRRPTTGRGATASPIASTTTCASR